MRKVMCRDKHLLFISVVVLWIPTLLLCTNTLWMPFLLPIQMPRETLQILTSKWAEIVITGRVTETHHLRPLQETSSLIPGVYFVYEFSPLRAVIKETHLPFFELCTSLCAILGGVFTMMGMIDGIIYSMARRAESRSRSGESELTQRMISKSD